MRTVLLHIDESPDFCSHEFYEPWASRAVTAELVPIGPLRDGYGTFRRATRPIRSGFDELAQLADTMPQRAGDLLGILLGSAFPVGGDGCEVLRPLWAEEAMHRSLGFMRLLHSSGCRRERSGVADLDHGIARDLAFQFRDLEAGAEREVVPCSAVLRDVIAGLGTLFGVPANVIVKTKIEDVSLPVYKRRALVLTATELVSNALMHAFAGRTSGRIEVDLTKNGFEAACLRVADNGIGFTDFPPNLTGGVAAGLAGLLEADLAYDRLAGWTIAEIAFPVIED